MPGQESINADNSMQSSGLPLAIRLPFIIKIDTDETSPAG